MTEEQLDQLAEEARDGYEEAEDPVERSYWALQMAVLGILFDIRILQMLDRE